MNVYCQKCQKAAAIVHITELKDGQKVELHLCEECAETQGVPPKVHPVSMLEFLQQWVEKSSGTTKGRDRQCPHCGMTFNEFKANGRFGCSHDYQIFQSRLIPLLERIHGASEHSPEAAEAKAVAVEKAVTAPPSAELSAARAELKRLRRELKQVIRNEKYEEAAQLRDRILELERQHGKEVVDE